MAELISLVCPNFHSFVVDIDNDDLDGADFVKCPVLGCRQRVVLPDEEDAE